MSQRSKRQKHKKSVAQGHVETIRKLKDQLHGRADDRAQYQATAKAAVKYAEERQHALASLEEVGADLSDDLRDLAKRLGAFDTRLSAAVETFDEPMPEDDSLQQVIEERDAALGEAAKLREEQAAMRAELSELRLHKLERTEPAPPNWLARAEREFDKHARILTNDLKTVVAQKALDWAKDHRLIHGHKGKGEAEE